MLDWLTDVILQWRLRRAGEAARKAAEEDEKGPFIVIFACSDADPVLHSFGDDEETWLEAMGEIMILENRKSAESGE